VSLLVIKFHHAGRKIIVVVLIVDIFLTFVIVSIDYLLLLTSIAVCVVCEVQ
jgi:hypothetical protein